MLEPLILIALALVVLGPILGLVAYVRTRSIDELRQKTTALEEEVRDLKRRVRAMSASAPVPAPEAAPPVAATLPRPPAPPTPPAAPSPTPIVVRPKPAVPEPPPSPPTPPSPPIDWERWVGIRGAAVLGAIVLALAGLLFFQYSIQHGLITPVMRVVLGIGAGIFAIVASEWLRPRGYHSTPEGMAGAGVVLLYAASWAGTSLYHLIPMPVCFGLMILVTVVCGLLAVRHASQLVAVLGLIGGFATPLLLRSDSDHPIGLFGYVLLLDLGLLAIGRRKRWPWLAALGLAGTVLLQSLWIGTRMGPDRLVLGLMILGLFAILFTAGGFVGRDADRGSSRLSQWGGLLVPFVFAIYFASRVDLGPHLWPVAILLAVLCAGASSVAMKQDTPWLGLAASAGSLGVFAIWQTRAPVGAAGAWESVAIAVGIALVFHVFVELAPERSGNAGPAAAAILTNCGFMVILVLVSARPADGNPWIWLCGWLALSALFYRHAAFPGRAYLQVLAAIGVAVGLWLQHVIHAGAPSFPPLSTFLAAAIGVAAFAQAVALFRQDEDVRGFADHAAAALAAIFALSLPFSGILASLSPALALGGALALGVLVLLAGTRRGAGGWSLVALLTTTVDQSAWVWLQPGLAQNQGEAQLALAFVIGGAALYVAWPFVAGGLLQADRLAWYAAALSGPAAFLAARKLWPSAVGQTSIGLLPIMLGAFALVAAFGARRVSLPGDDTRKDALVWFSAVAICFASVAIPLQLDKSWVTIGWALEGFALIVLWRRLDHPGLKWLALAHLAAATVRLFPTMAFLDSYPRSSVRIVNWVLYTYLVPAAALFASARRLAPEEPGRARVWERGLYANGKPAGAIGAATAGIVVVFVWINLAIADWFAEGPRLTLQFGRSPARDLTVSIAWAIYALVLLGFGMARANIGLRWLSLSFLVVTIGKVFLYDLGELHDLYRVVSLVGLAISLLLVSLLYQRFVFRRSSSSESS